MDFAPTGSDPGHEAYKRYEKQVEEGFIKAAKFLHTLHIYRIFDLPYQSQIVPLAAILADIGDAWEHESNRAKLMQWYWNGVFGELYGSAVDTRIARDFMEVPAWLKGGPEPSTVSDTIFRADRLKSMRMRLSAAYKGVNALLMKEGAQDFRSGQKFDHTIFFGESVDIHHIFPQEWLEQDLPCKRINKRFPNGKEVDVRVRETPFGEIQWFIGVYDRDGSILIEQYNGDVSARSLDAALAAAFARACGFAGVED